MGSQLLLGFSMRLTLVLACTTLGIVARANPQWTSPSPSHHKHPPKSANIKTQKGTPISDCNEFCTREYRPLCGTDGVTYDNPCLLEHEACKYKPDLRMAYLGKCKTEKGKTGGRINDVPCKSADYWSSMDEEFKGTVGTEGHKVYSYCAKNNSSPGRPPYTIGGPNNWNTGNYVEAAVMNSTTKDSLTIQVVMANTCIRNSSESECSCKSLLDRVIRSFRTTAKTILIQDFIAEPAMAGCRCYLGTAAKYGYRSVDIKYCATDPIYKFDQKNYVDKCEAIVKRSCAEDSDWLIKK